MTINLTQPAKNLSKEVPPDSFFSLRNLISMLGQLLIQFTVQICFLGYMLSFSLFNTLKLDGILSMQANGTFSDST